MIAFVAIQIAKRDQMQQRKSNQKYGRTAYFSLLNIVSRFYVHKNPII